MSARRLREGTPAPGDSRCAQAAHNHLPGEETFSEHPLKTPSAPPGTRDGGALGPRLGSALSLRAFTLEESAA